MNQTLGILFYVKNAKALSTGEVPIYLRITVDGKRAEHSIQRIIHPDKWNPKAGKAIGNKEDIRSLNVYIDTVKAKVYEQQKRLLERNEFITAEKIKNGLMGISEKKQTLIEVFKQHNKEIEALIGKDFAKGTVTRYKTVLKYLQEFLQSKYKTSDIYLSQLNHKFITDYEFYLKTERKCGHNSTIKYIRNLKKVVRIALSNDWLDKDPFMNYKGSLEDVERTFLSAEELTTIEDKKFKIARLAEIRDIFIFSCYTGLAYADVFNLTPGHITIGIDGDKWIYTHRTKTKTRSNVPLLPKALEIIEQYKKYPECIILGKVLPVRSNQKMNAYLKEIADLSEINKTLTFHTARHTFATTVTLTNNVPIESVSSMLGHKSIKTTQIYAKVVEKKVSADMQALRGKLEQNRPLKNLAK